MALKKKKVAAGARGNTRAKKPRTPRGSTARKAKPPVRRQPPSKPPSNVLTLDMNVVRLRKIDRLATLYETLYSDLAGLSREEISHRFPAELGCFVACHVAHYLVRGGRCTPEMRDKWFASPVLELAVELLVTAETQEGGIEQVGLPV